MSLPRARLFPVVALLASCDAQPADVGEDRAEIGRACARHGDCGSDVCDVYRPTGFGPGRCIPEASVLYVDQNVCEPGAGDGSRAAPFCAINEAVARADEARFAVRVYPGLYFPFGVAEKQVAVYGSDPGDEPVEVTEEDVSGVQISGGARVVLDGLVLGRHSRFGVRCIGTSGPPAASTSVDVRRSEVLSDVGTAFIASACNVRLDRNVVAGLFGSMQLTDTLYLVTNSVFTGSSERPAISLNGGEGRFFLDTVTGNGDPDVQPPTIACLTPALIEDSIVFGNATSRTGSQFDGDCRLRRTVVGSADPIESPGAIHKDPDLDGFDLPVTPANLDCCIDRAPTRLLIRRDLEGTRRPQGARFDIGADEAERVAR
jgi:hypothetical protein